MTIHYGSALTREAAQEQFAPAELNADEMIERIVELRPWLRSMQAEAERQRRVPQETVERLDQTGAYALAMPPRFGGADFSARDLFRIYEALGQWLRGDDLDALGLDRRQHVERGLRRRSGAARLRCALGWQPDLRGRRQHAAHGRDRSPRRRRLDDQGGLALRHRAACTPRTPIWRCSTTRPTTPRSACA